MAMYDVCLVQLSGKKSFRLCLIFTFVENSTF